MAGRFQDLDSRCRLHYLAQFWWLELQGEGAARSRLGLLLLDEVARAAEIFMGAELEFEQQMLQ